MMPQGESKAHQKYASMLEKMSSEGIHPQFNLNGCGPFLNTIYLCDSYSRHEGGMSAWLIRASTPPRR
jgi:hypothetical protein